MGPHGGGRQDNGARPVRRPGTNAPWHHGGPPFVKLIGPRLKNWTNFNSPERKGAAARCRLTQPSPWAQPWDQKLLTGTSHSGGGAVPWRWDRAVEMGLGSRAGGQAALGTHGQLFLPGLLTSSPWKRDRRWESPGVFSQKACAQVLTQ